jgi:hypothetical protein
MISTDVPKNPILTLQPPLAQPDSPLTNEVGSGAAATPEAALSVRTHDLELERTASQNQVETHSSESSLTP